MVVPLSTLANWAREFAAWTDLNALVFHGNEAARERMKKYEWHFSPVELDIAANTFNIAHSRATSSSSSSSSSSPTPLSPTSVPGPAAGLCVPRYKFQAVITSYETLIQESAFLSKVQWRVLVVDEAHRLKNRKSRLTRTLKEQFSFRSSLLLTGTPIQNSVEELWTLLNFLDPRRFPNVDAFSERYGAMSEVSTLSRLRDEIKGYMLRRLKEDVEKSLAVKEETIVEVELSSRQKQYYRALYERNTAFLAPSFSGGISTEDTRGPSLNNIAMQLRKCCNHPFLIQGAEDRIVEEESEALRTKQRAKGDDGKGVGEKRPAVATSVDATSHASGGSGSEDNEESLASYTEILVRCSGKMMLLDKLLPRLKAGGHRVLIFSQMVRMLDVLETYLYLRGHRFVRFDGGVSGSERQRAIGKCPGLVSFFSLPSSCFFLCAHLAHLPVHTHTHAQTHSPSLGATFL